MIRVENLTISSADVAILDHLNVQVSPGQRVALVGKSGSGKTTLALALLGEITPGLKVTGTVSVFGEIIVNDANPASHRASSRAIRSVRRRIGHLDQVPAASLNPAHTVATLVNELAVPGAMSLQQALNTCGLPADSDFLNRYPGELSGGQQRRVALARILRRRPELLILDEPTAGLDLASRDIVLDLISTVVNELDSTLVVITHDEHVAATLADEYFSLADGRLIPADVATERKGCASERVSAAAIDSESTPVLRVEGLVARPLGKKRPGHATPVINGLDFTIGVNEALAVIGPSGSGKTTLARCLLGLWPRLDGDVYLDEQLLPAHVSSRPAHLCGAIGWVPQDSLTTVNSVLTLGKSMRRAAQRRQANTVAMTNVDLNRLCQRLGLPEDWATRFPHQLSGGQLQRFAIGRALVAGPRLLILDEVTSSLDPATRDDICSLLVELKKEVAMMVITHDPVVIERVCDRVLDLSATSLRDP